MIDVIPEAIKTIQSRIDKKRMEIAILKQENKKTNYEGSENILSEVETALHVIKNFMEICDG